MSLEGTGAGGAAGMGEVVEVEGAEEGGGTGSVMGLGMEAKAWRRKAFTEGVVNSIKRVSSGMSSGFRDMAVG